MRCCGGVESFTSIMAVDHDAIPSSVARLCTPVRARSLSICHAICTFSVGTCGDCVTHCGAGFRSLWQAK